MTVHVIAEAGVNHNGNLECAFEMIDAAAEAGADTVKFQAFKAENLASRFAPKAEYQHRTTAEEETHLGMLRKLELPLDAYPKLIERCTLRGIGFLVSPFDLPSIDFLARELGLEVLKIPSGELTNGPLLLAAGRTGKRLILSTGMATLDEIRAALDILATGFTGPGAPADPAPFAGAAESPEGRAVLRDKVTLMHATTEYPAPFTDANLRAMDTMRDTFGLPVGLSDHTPGIAVAIAAVALGAIMIEKHFTLDREQSGPDHQASLEPPALKEMIDGIRATEAALGDGIKKPRPSEIKNIPIARKSLVAIRPIRKGEAFGADNVTAKRPGNGVSPMGYWDCLGRLAERDYAEDEALDPWTAGDEAR